jgi:hypothetical protein
MSELSLFVLEIALFGGLVILGWQCIFKKNKAIFKPLTVNKCHELEARKQTLKSLFQALESEEPSPSEVDV